jgi:ATP-dependent helicase/nuclease subunit A
MLEETEDEYRRLLYVAMTRAADRLIISGCMPGNMNNVRSLCWYDLVRRGLAGSGLQEHSIDTQDGSIKRYSRPQDAAPAGGPATRTANTPVALPSWLRTPVSPDAPAIEKLRPSDSGGAGHKVTPGIAMASRARAIQRGTLVHRLLQSLPDIAAERRPSTAITYLARNATDWSEAERASLADSVLGLIGDSRFAAVFGETSRAEVPIVGRVSIAGRAPAFVSGQIDRLVVSPDEVLIVDFKTNQSPPRTAAEAPQAYVRQLALYRALLGKLYPQRRLRAALLWTEAPELMEIFAPALDAELASFGAGMAELDPATGRS